jgi:hypothetical protein
LDKIQSWLLRKKIQWQSLSEDWMIVNDQGHMCQLVAFPSTAAELFLYLPEEICNLIDCYCEPTPDPLVAVIKTLSGNSNIQLLPHSFEEQMYHKWLRYVSDVFLFEVLDAKMGRYSCVQPVLRLSFLRSDSFVCPEHKSTPIWWSEIESIQIGSNHFNLGYYSFPKKGQIAMDGLLVKRISKAPFPVVLYCCSLGIHTGSKPKRKRNAP